MIRLILFFFLLAMGLAGTSQQQDWRSLDSALTYLHQTHRFNGTVLYAENGKVLYKKAFGIVSPDSNERLTTASAFNLASVTKQFVCMAILLLQEQQLLHIDDKVQKILPALPYPEITIRQLMNHMSGIPEYFDLVQQYRTPLDTLDNESMIRLFATYKPALEFSPGSSFNYCNTNYVLLASVVEKVSGIPLDQFIRERIVKPLDLPNTYMYHLKMPASPPNRVNGFEEVNGKKKLNDLVYLDGVVGDGNLYSSVEDLYAWEQSLYTEKLLKNQTMSSVFQPAKLADGSTSPYGFGWEIAKEGALYYHTGGWVGFVNIICRDVKKKRTLILLSSGSNGTAMRLAKSFFAGEGLTVKTTTLIKNVMLVDGTGSKARAASVRISGKQIVSVGDLNSFAGEKVIDGQGKILSPGFIDTHSHLAGYLDNNPEALAALNQGVTTIVAGQDGGGDWVDSIKAFVKRKPVAINVATYAGHTSIRRKVMGASNLARPATQPELDSMKQLLKQELQKGALGMSTGLEYEGAFYSSRHEVLALAKIAAAEKARYMSHVRSEDVGLNDAMDEIISIGKEARLPVQISHFKLALKDDWGSSPQWLARLQQARAEGIDITADCYPYDYWNSTLRVLFPHKDFASLSAAQYAVDHLFDPAGSVLVRYKPDISYQGKTVAQVAAMRRETTAQTLLYLVAAASTYEQQHPDEDGVETIMGKSMLEADVANIMSWAHTNICSDGGNGGHPRGYGSFTRVLAHYVRQMKIMSLETAINKMTGLAAEHVGISNRGIVAPGYFADLVLLDPNKVVDRATIQQSTALSDGILKVWVNGDLVYADKSFQHIFPGEFVSKK